MYPFSRLFVDSARAVVVAGPHIQVIETVTGKVLASSDAFPATDRDVIIKSGPIRCATLDHAKKHLATVGDDKLLKIWEVDGLKLLSERELPKRATSILFTSDDQTILVADKFGDVFSYSFTPVVMSEKQKRDALSSHENPSGGQLILGHVSLLTAFVLVPDERYIITADRDEHIRVSWYPQGYNIEMYCLGQEKYVSALHIPPFAPSQLISGGGDPVLKIWDWMKGEVQHTIEVFSVVEPFITISRTKRKWADLDDEDQGGDSSTKPTGRKRRSKKQASKDSTPRVPSPIPDEEASTLAVQLDVSNSTPQPKTLVIHKIETILDGQARYIVFSAIGATALFFCRYPEGEEHVRVHAFDFGIPVADFDITSSNDVWVSIDGNQSVAEGQVVKFTRVLQFSSGALVEPLAHSPLLDALNGPALLSATERELNNFDIYDPLASLPKGFEASHDPSEDMEGAIEEPGKSVSKKELGRQKSKKAVKAKLAAIGPDAPEIGTEEESREPKRSRSEQSHSDRDVEMEV